MTQNCFQFFDVLYQKTWHLFILEFVSGFLERLFQNSFEQQQKINKLKYHAILAGHQSRRKCKAQLHNLNVQNKTSTVKNLGLAIETSGLRNLQKNLQSSHHTEGSELNLLQVLCYYSNGVSWNVRLFKFRPDYSCRIDVIKFNFGWYWYIAKYCVGWYYFIFCCECSKYLRFF